MVFVKQPLAKPVDLLNMADELINKYTFKLKIPKCKKLFLRLVSLRKRSHQDEL